MCNRTNIVITKTSQTNNGKPRIVIDLNVRLKPYLDGNIFFVLTFVIGSKKPSFYALSQNRF